MWGPPSAFSAEFSLEVAQGFGVVLHSRKVKMIAALTRE